MATAFRNIERAREDLAQLHAELLQLERRVNSVRESLGKAITELFRTDRHGFPVLQEAALAARVAEAVVSRLPVPSTTPGDRKEYVTDHEAAAYMGMSVAPGSGKTWNQTGRLSRLPQIPQRVPAELHILPEWTSQFLALMER